MGCHNNDGKLLVQSCQQYNFLYLEPGKFVVEGTNQFPVNVVIDMNNLMPQ